MRKQKKSEKLVSFFLLGLLVLIMHHPLKAYAVPMTNDPNGFEDLAWGTILTAIPNLEVAQIGSQINEYQLRDHLPFFAGVPVQHLRFLSIDGQFARVTIRYQGDDQHKQILLYLEDRFGSLTRIQGQMMRGLNQQYTWRGTNTEISLTYHANTERGYVFIDSRTFAPRFLDHIAESAE